jgi:hypothetical protein
MQPMKDDLPKLIEELKKKPPKKKGEMELSEETEDILTEFTEDVSKSEPKSKVTPELEKELEKSREVTLDDILPPKTMVKIPSIRDFVTYYIESMDILTDAHKDYKEACALYLLSTFMGHKFTLIQWTNRKLNFWFMLIGRSRLARKNTVMIVAREIIDRISPIVTTTWGTKKNPKTVETKIRIPYTFTKASYIEQMNLREENKKAYATWVHTEVSGWFEELVLKYNRGLVELISDVYDGHSYESSTKGGGVVKIAEPFFTMLVGSTPDLPQQFKKQYVKQGFLNRFLFVTDKLDERELRPDMAEKIPQDRMDTIAYYLTILSNFSEGFKVGFVTGSKPHKKFLEFSKKIMRMLTTDKNLDQMYASYLGYLPTLIEQLACVYAISSLDFEDLRAYRALTPDLMSKSPDLIKAIHISEEDLNRATNFMQRRYKDFQEIIQLSRMKEWDKATPSEESTLLTVYKAIEKTAGADDWSMHSQALKYSKLLIDPFKKVIETLKTTNCIDRKAEKNAKGRMVNYYKVLTPP